MVADYARRRTDAKFVPARPVDAMTWWDGLSDEERDAVIDRQIERDQFECRR